MAPFTTSRTRAVFCSTTSSRHFDAVEPGTKSNAAGASSCFTTRLSPNPVGNVV